MTTPGEQRPNDDILPSADEETETSSQVEPFDLTAGELEDLRLATLGMTRKEVASHRFVVEDTVRSVRHNILRKMGASTIEQAVYLGIKSGLIPVMLRDTKNLDYKLSSRQFEVLKLACQGLKGPAVADAMNVSVQTAKHHRRLLYTELRARNMADAIRIAFELGILPFDEENPDLADAQLAADDTGEPESIIEPEESSQPSVHKNKPWARVVPPVPEPVIEYSERVDGRWFKISILPGYPEEVKPVESDHRIIRTVEGIEPEAYRELEDRDL